MPDVRNKTPPVAASPIPTLRTPSEPSARAQPPACRRRQREEDTPDEHRRGQIGHMLLTSSPRMRALYFGSLNHSVASVVSPSMR
jgi:hypothetical protein